jgi:hypothetical protein
VLFDKAQNAEWFLLNPSSYELRFLNKCSV